MPTSLKSLVTEHLTLRVEGTPDGTVRVHWLGRVEGTEVEGAVAHFVSSLVEGAHREDHRLVLAVEALESADPAILGRGLRRLDGHPAGSRVLITYDPDSPWQARALAGNPRARPVRRGLASEGSSTMSRHLHALPPPGVPDDAPRGFRLPHPSPLAVEVGGRVLPVAEASPVHVRVDAAELPGEPVEVSLVGGGHRVGPIGVSGVESRDGWVELELAPEAAQAGALLALLLRLAGAGLAWPPGSRDLPSERIREERRIGKLFRALLHGHATGRIHGKSGVTHGPLHLAGYQPDADRPLTWELEGTVPEPPFEVELGGYNSAFLFEVRAVERREGGFASGLPEHVVRTRTRRHRRVRAPGGARVRLSHPRWPDRALDRPLLDLSLSGLALETAAEEDLLFPGLVLPSVEVRWPGGDVLNLRGVVRRLASQDGRGLAGVELALAGDETAERWFSHVMAELHPRTAVSAASPDQLWELYGRSGYFEISGGDAEHFEVLRRAFGKAQARLPQAPKVAVQVDWPSERGVECAMTSIKPYAHTWIPCQLARQPGEEVVGVDGRQILRDVLLHGYEYLQGDADFRWLVTWVHVSARFGRHVAYDLAARWAPVHPDVVVRPYRALEGDVRAGPDRPARFEVGLARPDETAALLGVIGRSWPRPYAEAHDLVPERMDLAQVRGVWEAAGLERDRLVLAARRGGEAVAAAVVESAEAGLHLYGFFDLVRPFALTPGGEAAFPDLVAAARHWYGERAKTRFTLFMEDPWDFAEAGLTDLGAADLLVLPGDLLPDQLEHLWEITAPARGAGGVGHAA